MSPVRSVNDASADWAATFMSDQPSVTLRPFLEQFGPARWAPAGYRLPATETELCRGTTLIVGGAGSGKSFVLARIVQSLSAHAERPVLHISATELFSSSPGPGLAEADVNGGVERALRQRGVDRKGAEAWASGAGRAKLFLVIDGVEDVGDALEEVLDSVRRWREKSASFCLVSQRVSDREPGECAQDGWDVYHMPPLPAAIVHEVAGELLGMAIPENGLEEEIRTPLMFRYLLELHQRGVPSDPNGQLSAEDIVHAYVNLKLADQSPQLAQLARSLTVAEQVPGSNIGLTSFRPPLVKRRAAWEARALWLLMLGSVLVSIMILGGLALGVGRRAVWISLCYIFCFFFVGISPLGAELVERRSAWRLCHRRMWSPRQVVASLKSKPSELMNRVVVGTAHGLVSGLVLWMLTSGGVAVSANDGSASWVWVAFLALPALVAFLGSLKGGLISGVILAIALGAFGDPMVCLVGGGTAGFTAGWYFWLVDVGELVEPVKLADTQGSRLRVVRAWWRSGWVFGAFDVAAWAGYGLAYGVTSAVLQQGVSPWLIHGLLIGLAGAILFGVTGLLTPSIALLEASYAARRSGLIHNMDLLGPMNSLVVAGILVSSDERSGWKFSHPLFASWANSQPIAGADR